MTDADLIVSKEERLKEERKIWPIEKPLHRKLVRCPQCGGIPDRIDRKTKISIINDNGDIEEITLRRVNVYKCKDCSIIFIPDVHLIGICNLYGNDKLIAVTPDDCKSCPNFPGKNKTCEHWKGYLKHIKSEEWVKK